MAIFCFLAFASFVQLVGRLLSKRRVVGSNPARVFWFEYSDLRAEAVGAAPAEHGTASVEMSAVQEFVTAFDFEARPCARPVDEVDGNRFACTCALMARMLQEGSACIEDCHGGQL
jgi:hypothetical protein